MLYLQALQGILAYISVKVRPDFVAYNHQYAKNLSRRICHRLYGNLEVAWTIKNQEELERAKKQFDLFIFDSFLPDQK